MTESGEMLIIILPTFVWVWNMVSSRKLAIHDMLPVIIKIDLRLFCGLFGSLLPACMYLKRVICTRWAGHVACPGRQETIQNGEWETRKTDKINDSHKTDVRGNWFIGDFC